MYGTPPPPGRSSPSMFGTTGEAPVAITTPSLAVRVVEVPSGLWMESCTGGVMDRGRAGQNGLWMESCSRATVVRGKTGEKRTRWDRDVRMESCQNGDGGQGGRAGHKKVALGLGGTPAAPPSTAVPAPGSSRGRSEAHRLWSQEARLPDDSVDAKLGEGLGRIVLVVNLVDRRAHPLHHLAIVDAHLARRHTEPAGGPRSVRRIGA